MKPKEILEVSIETSVDKCSYPIGKMIVLGVLGGAFIAFAAQGSTMAAFNLLMNPDTFGLGKALAGAIFGTGLMLVVIAGGELFTGNCLAVTGVMAKRVSIPSFIRNLIVIYLTNFVGAVLMAFLIYYSGQFEGGTGMLGAATIKIAAGKVNLDFIEAVILGTLCNWLVCLAVWMAWGAENIIGKIFAIFFPIWLFITSGFEHSIANMYYIPAGILAKADLRYMTTSGVAGDGLDNLTWSNFFTDNLLPVTIGNIIGGMVFVGMVYFIAYRTMENKKT